MAEWNDSPTEIAKEFNLRVDLNDPAVRDFLRASGIPESDWGEFDQSRQAQAQPAAPPQIAQRPDPLGGQEVGIPGNLRELGVVGILLYPAYNFLLRQETERFVLKFHDGDVMEYEFSRWDVWQRFPHLVGDDQAIKDRMIAGLIDAVHLHRVLPFDTLD